MNAPRPKQHGAADVQPDPRARHTRFELLLELLKPALVVVLTIDGLQRSHWAPFAPSVGQTELMVVGYLALSQAIFWFRHRLRRALFALSLFEAVAVSLIYGFGDDLFSFNLLIYLAAAGIGARVSAERAGACASAIWAMTALPALLWGRVPLAFSGVVSTLLSGAGLLLIALLGHHLIIADRERARHQAEAAAVHEMTRGVNASLDPDVVTHTLTRHVSHIFAGRTCLIAFADQDLVYLDIAETYPPPSETPPARVPLAAGGLLAQVFAAHQPAVITSLESDPSLGWLSEAGASGSALAAPLMLRRQTRGVIALVARQEDAFDHHHVRLLETVAAHAATAIDHARLYTAAERETVVLSHLYEFSRTLSQTHGYKHRLHTVAEMSKRLVDGEGAVVLAPHGSGPVLVPVDFSGSAAAGLSELTMSRDDPALAPILDDGKPVVAPPALGLPEGDTTPYAIVPLSRHRDLFGVLLVTKAKGQSFAPSELQLLFMVAQHATLSLENARRFEEAQRRATSDGLTGLVNHKHFQERLRQEVARSQRYGSPLALVMMDVDNFKRLNDTEGHPRGDALLRGVAEILRVLCRRSDVLARYGGDEFAVIATESDAAQAAVLAERIRAQVEALAEVGGAPLQVPITLSLGVAGYGEHADSAGDLVDTADRALAVAKQGGRNRVLIAQAQPEPAQVPA